MIFEKIVNIISRFRNGTIRTRILIAFVPMAVLPVIVVTGASSVVNFRWGYGQVINQLESVITLKEAEIDLWLYDLQLDLRTELEDGTATPLLGALLRAAPGSPEFQRAHTEQMKRSMRLINQKRRFEELFLMDLRGKVVFSTRPSTEGEFRGLQTYFREGVEKAGVHIQTLSFSSTSEGINTVVAVQPLRDRQGHAFGVLAGRASLAALNTIMRERAGLKDTGETYLVGSNYVLLTQSRFPGYEPGKKYVHSVGAKAALRDHANGSASYDDYRGMPVLGVYRWQPRLGVALLAEQDRQEAFGPLHTHLAINVVVTVAAVLIAVLLSIRIAGSIAGPIADVAHTAARIAAGNLELTVDLESNDEIGTLAQSFNNMTVQLRDMITGLEQRVSDRTALLLRRSEELEQANESLKEVDRLKSLFITSMSHELRTPLNAVIGFSTVLLDEWVGPVNAEQKQNLASILGSGRHLLNMINDILDATQIEAGTIKPVIEEFDLYDLLAEAESEVAAGIREKGLELRSELLRRPMRTDRRRLLQCVLNILSNAAKYTDNGGVTVEARIVSFSGETPEEEMVEIAVTDTGIGVGEEDQSRIFQPFYRIVTPQRTIVPGTGLGLFLTRKIATEILKGDLLVSSEYGKGSRFSLRIPVRLP